MPQVNDLDDALVANVSLALPLRSRGHDADQIHLETRFALDDHHHHHHRAHSIVGFSHRTILHVCTQRADIYASRPNQITACIRTILAYFPPTVIDDAHYSMIASFVIRRFEEKSHIFGHYPTLVSKHGSHLLSLSLVRYFVLGFRLLFHTHAEYSILLRSDPSANRFRDALDGGLLEKRVSSKPYLWENVIDNGRSCGNYLILSVFSIEIPDI